MAELWQCSHPEGADFGIAFDTYSSDGRGLTLAEFALLLDHEPFASIMPEAIERTGDSSCSPYVVLTLGTEQQHTTAGTTWDHTWAEAFGFDIYDEEDILGFAVFGKARLHPLGSTHLSLAEVTAIHQGEQLRRWFPLSGSEAGELELSVSWSPSLEQQQGSRSRGASMVEVSPPTGSSSKTRLDRRSRSKSPSDREYLDKRPF